MTQEQDELLALGKGITEGEWEVRDQNVHSEGRCVARTNWPIRDEQDDANARAIAAVPRLFARIEHDAATIAELRAGGARLTKLSERRYAQPCDRHEYIEPRCPDCGKMAALKPTSNERDG